MESLKLKYEPLVTASLAKQIAEKIRESIADGTLKADDRLPTEDELANLLPGQVLGFDSALVRLRTGELAIAAIIGLIPPDPGRGGEHRVFTR